MNVFHHYLFTDVCIYFLLWPFILSFGDILPLFIRRIMYFFFSFTGFFMFFCLSFSFLQSRVLFFLSLVLFLFLFFPHVLFLLVFENINRTPGFVTCENYCRQQSETARGKNLSSVERTFYLSQLSCFLKTAGNGLVQIGGNNV